MRLQNIVYFEGSGILCWGTFIEAEGVGLLSGLCVDQVFSGVCSCAREPMSPCCPVNEACTGRAGLEALTVLNKAARNCRRLSCIAAVSYFRIILQRHKRPFKKGPCWQCECIGSG